MKKSLPARHRDGAATMLAATVFLGTWISLFDGMGGVALSWVGWTSSLAGGVFLCLISKKRRAPLDLIALAWVVFLLAHGLFSPYPFSLQQAAIVAAPAVVLLAASGLTITTDSLERLQALTTLSGFVILAAFAIKRVVDAEASMAALNTTSVLVGYFAITLYYYTRRPIFLLAWAACALSALLGLNRGPMVLLFISPILALGPIPASARALLLAGFGSLAVIVFQLPQVQAKLFYSGYGTVGDLLDFSNLNTSGRFNAWAYLADRLPEPGMIGYGIGATRDVLLPMSTAFAHPHNDYLRIYYELGWVGVVSYAALVGGLLVRLARLQMHPSRRINMWAGCALGGSMGYLGLMLVDNVFVYASFFGDVLAFVIGLLMIPELRPRSSVLIRG